MLSKSDGIPEAVLCRVGVGSLPALDILRFCAEERLFSWAHLQPTTAALAQGNGTGQARPEVKRGVPAASVPFRPWSWHTGPRLPAVPRRGPTRRPLEENTAQAQREAAAGLPASPASQVRSSTFPIPVKLSSRPGYGTTGFCFSQWVLPS